MNKAVKWVDNYINNKTWYVSENSNNGFCYPSLKSNLAGNAISQYCLETMYKGKIAEAHETGAIHIHDLTNGFAPYCVGLNLRDLLMNGLNGVKGRVSSKPPKKLSTACLQMANLIGCVQNEVSGAIAFNSVDTFLAPYVRKMCDEDDNYWIHYETKSGVLDSQIDYAKLYTDVKQSIQELVYNLNQPTRSGEIPFSNMSFDLTIPDSLKDQHPMVGGEVMPYTYGDLQSEANIILCAYLDVMYEGDSIGRIFPFPIPTFSVTKDFDFDSEVSQKIFKLTAKYGTPYFQNFINSDLNPADVRSMCCFTGNTELIYRNKGKIGFTTLREIHEKGNIDFDVLQKGKWVPAKSVKVEYNRPFIKVKLRNGLELTMTDNHINYTDRGLLRGDELKVGDKIPFNSERIEKEGYGCYEIGKLIGLYLAEGSGADRQSLQFSLSAKEVDIAEFILNTVDKYFVGGGNISKNTGDSISVFVHSPSFKALIQKFVSGKAIDKNLLCVDSFNTECLQGIWDGWLLGDGKKLTEGKTIYNLEYYTCSEQLAKTMLLVGRMLGYAMSLNTRVRDTQFKKGSVLYSLRICNTKTGHIYKNSEVEIVSIETIPNNNKVAFCVEVLGDSEPMFEIGYGCLTHNCRLSLSLDELRRSGSVFNSWDSTGSVGVVTINLPQLTKFGTNLEGHIQRLTELLEIAKESLELKRSKINELWEGGNLFPYLAGTLPHRLKRHFSTIGINGMAEYLELCGIENGTTEAKDRALYIIQKIKECIMMFQKETGHLYNFEETPAESACYRFAKTDGFGYEYYTQGAKLPFDYTADILDKADYEEDILTEYTGGSVLHMFMGEAPQDTKAVAQLIKRMLTAYRVPYITFTPTFSVCLDHGYISGEHWECPTCGKECEVYTRIVGYHSPVNRWNVGKQAEYRERKTFD